MKVELDNFNHLAKVEKNKIKDDKAQEAIYEHQKMLKKRYVNQKQSDKYHNEKISKQSVERSIDRVTKCEETEIRKTVQ